MPNANHDGGDGQRVVVAVPGANGVAREVDHNKAAAVREKNGGVHNGGAVAGKVDNNHHDDGRR